jgi:MFS family permease
VSDATARSDSRVIAVAALGAAVVTSGVQGVAPAIPVIQDQFALTAAQVGLITSVYLLPSIVSAIPAGMLADRVGGRAVFTGALVVYCAGGVVLLLEHSLVAFFAVRLVQGAAFGAILSLSVALIGSVSPAGPAAARAQGRRIVTMAVAEATLPVAGGLLLALAWFAPFGLQLLAGPVALLAWAWLPAGSRAARTPRGAGARAVLGSPALYSVQALGALRFVFKFAFLTYFPLLGVQVLGASPGQVGFLIGGAAALTAVAAALTERLAVRWSSAQLIGGSLAATAVSLGLLGTTQGLAVAVVALVIFGIQDGVYGVGHNVLVTELAPRGARSTYIGVTGTVRNVGKFTAPLLFGASTLVLSVAHAFVLLAVVGGASTVVAARVARVQSGLGGPV